MVNWKEKEEAMTTKFEEYIEKAELQLRSSEPEEGAYARVKIARAQVYATLALAEATKRTG